MSRKVIVLFLILSIILFLLAGGTNVYDIDRLAYVVALGLDIGENNEIRLSFQLSIPGGQDSSGSGSSQSDDTVINTIEASSIDSGINLLNSYISKEVNLSHCKVIVFSEEFAYNGISESIFTLMNNIQIRPDCNVIISRCNAEYFLNNSKPMLEKLSARYYDIAPSSSDYTGYTENITLSEFFSDLNDTTKQCYGILGGINTNGIDSSGNLDSNIEKDADNKADETMISSESTIENMGLAVFKNDKLVGELTGIDTVCHLIISNKLNICNITIPDPFNNEKTVSLRLTLKNNTKNSVDISNNSPYITSFVYLEARILSMDNDSKYLNEDNIEVLEKYINSYMSDKIYDYLYKVSKDFNSDIDGFGKYVTKNFLTWDEWENYNWLNNFQNSFFKVSIDVSVESGYTLMET